MISIVIPTCGREKLLLESVGSVLSQEFSHFEILIVDQGSPGSLPQRIQEAFPAETRIRYFHIRRAGASAARNFGMAQAFGSMVAFLDDDAAADPGWLQALAAVLATHTGVALVAGRLRPRLEAPVPGWLPRSRQFLLGLYDAGAIPGALAPHDQPIAANMAVRKDIAAAAGGFPEELGPSRFHRWPLLSGEEALLSMRLRRAGACAWYEPRMSAAHFISRAKLTRSYYLKRHFWEGVASMEQLRLLGDLEGRRSEQVRRIMVEAAAAAGRWILPSRFGASGERGAANVMLVAGKLVESLGAFTALTFFRRGCR